MGYAVLRLTAEILGGDDERRFNQRREIFSRYDSEKIDEQVNLIMQLIKRALDKRKRNEPLGEIAFRPRILKDHIIDMKI